MSVCRVRESQEVVSSIRQIRRWHDGPELDAKGWALAIAEDLEIDPDTFSLALQMTGENNEVRHLLNSYGIDTTSLLEESSGLIVPKTNTVELINSHDIDDMFHGIPAAAKYFEGRTNRQVATEAWLNRGEASNYVENNETVSKNMQYLKNDLFKNIQKFLIEKGELPGETTAKALFDDFRLVDFAYYNRVMETAANHFFKGDYAMLNSYTNKKIPNISKDNTLGNKVYEAYSDLIFLANFDTVIKNNFGHMIKINGKFLDTIEGSPTHDKYSVKADAVSTMFWSNDTHASDGAQSLNTKMASMLINVVPAFDKEGNKLPIFMEMNDMYLFSAVIADFELEHGNRMLADTGNGFDYLSKDTSKQFEWYLNTIMDSFLSEDSTNANKEIIKKHFEPYSNIIYSLHAFINDTDLNIPMKEQTADITIKELFGQVLGNSYGAIYHIYNSSGDLTVQQVYSQDFNSTGLQNTIFSKLRSVSHNDTYYSMKDARNIAEFNALFEGVDGKVTMLENIYNNVNFYEGINSYIHDNTGLKIDREILLKTAEDLQKNVGGRVITTNEFRTALSNLMHSISQDFTNNILTRETESIEQREARFDSNIGKLIPATINERLYKAMSKTILARFPIKSVSNITTLTGETIPAYKLANLTYKDTDLFDSQRNYEKTEGNIYKSLFLAEDRVILGTTTKLEIINDSGHTKTNKSAGKMIAMESLMSDFNYGFLESISAEENPTFNVMIGNYSDKGTILSKLIDGNWTIKDKLVREMTGEEIAGHVRTQGYRFYRDALFNVFNDYNTIFDLAGVPHTTLEVSEDMDGPETDQSINELNRILSEYDIKDIIHRANRPDIKIIEELHYSKYGDTYAVNQVLADNYRIFSDETRFKQFSNIQENNIIDKYNGIKGSVTENDSPLTRITSKHLEALNLADSEFDFTEFRSKEGEFNPAVKKWLWMNALARNEYLYMSTKGEYMHPQKKSKLRHSNVTTGKINPVVRPKVVVMGNTVTKAGVTRVQSEAEAKEAIDQIIYESQFIKTTDDEKHYIDSRDGTLYDRVSNFTKTSNISDTNLNAKTATTLGTKFDNLARDFFSDSMKPLQEYELASNEAFREVLQGLYELKQKMEANGETIIANDVTLHNKELMLAGTVDLITYDKQGRIRIYDFKTMKGDNFTERYNAYNRETDGLTKYYTKDFGQSKEEQHTNQTSLYSIMANNTYGLESAELVIIPVALDYDVKVYKDYPVGTPMSQIEADIKNVRTKSLELLPLVDIVPKTTIVGEIREGQQTKVATLRDLNTTTETSSRREVAKRNADKIFLFGQNSIDRNSDLSGIPNAIGIDLRPKPKKSLKKSGQVEGKPETGQTFLTDKDFNIFKERVDTAINQAVESGKTIVFQTNAEGKIDFGQTELENAPKLKEYLYNQLDLLHKGEILPKKKLDAAANFSMDYWQEYLEEVAERMVVMSKRNVTNTATFEVAVRNSILGTSPTVNIAAMGDFVTGTYSVTGQKQYAMSTDEDGNTVKKEFQDAHDGSSFLNYVYSRMVDAAYPGKGYEGTKKRFGTLVTDHGVVVKKDSESVITNEKIRNSGKSAIQLRSIQQRMLDLDINDLNITYNKKFLGEQFFKRLGKFYQITEIDLSKNAEGQHILDLELSVEGVDGSWTSQRISSQVNTLYDIWNSIGGEFSTNSEGGWTEGSNDMLYDLVVHSENTDLNGDTKKGLLKDKMIHIVSNQTALKAGATNINKSDAWTTNKRLLYATFESKFMGPQLDASHDMDNSEVHEITQIISALAQGGHTSEMAREAYEDIRNVIVETSQTYVKHLDGLNNVDISQEDRKTKLLDYLSHRFMDSLGNTKGNDIAKTLVHNLKSDGVNIPFSNQNFYSAFVKDVISRMNVDFISRKYPGIGAILSASQGIIQVYDIDVTNEDGTTTTVQANQGDIAKIALDTYNEQDFISRHGKAAESNHEIIDDYIFMNMQDKDVTLGEIEIGDIIRVGDKEISLTNPEEYYKFKADFSGKNTSALTGETSLITMENMLFKKVMNRPRDLKPTLHSFTHNGSRRNVFDFQSIKFRYYLENINNPSVVQSMGSENKVIMSNLINYINRKYGGKDNYVSLESLAGKFRMNKFVRSFLNNWTQRNFSLLEHNLTTPVVDKNTDFERYFQNDDVMVDVLEDVIDNYRASTVSDVQFKEAELILGDMYKNNFDRSDHETMYEIFRQKEQFFTDKILKDYVKDDTDADLKIISTRSDTPVYVKYVEELPYTDDSAKLTKDRGDGVNENMNNYVRRGLENEVLYRVPDMRNVVVKRENNSDVIYVKWSNYSTKDGHIINKDFYKVMNTLLKSFGNDLKTIVPLMRDNSEYDTVEKGELSSIDLNEVTLDMFQKYTGIQYELDLTKGSIFESAEDLASILAKKKYSSWLKSHEVVAARIPAQSMQSFMPMRNIAYNVGSKNDAFVSISQIWLQGSDFDIDKAYILGYSFNKKGNYNSWSNLTNYSTKGQLDALNKLPKANNSILQIAENTAEIDATLSNYYSEILTMLPVTYNSLEPEVINVFNKMIRYINKNEITHLAIDPNLDQGDFPISLVVEYINRHNKQIEGKEGENSLLNKVVSKIQDVISAPSNQMHANSPITIQDWHDVVNSVKKRKESTPETKMIMTEVVKDNADIFQTRDIIGISKMLTENHMGSEFFYDAKKKEVGVLENGMTIEEYKAIRKSDDWKSVPGYTIEYLDERYRDFVEFKNVTQTPASPYDMISYYILQQNASVGKEDVGIAANGVKSFFALSDYFNNFYKGIANETDLRKLRTSHEMFQKSFDFILPGGRDIKFRSNTIADIQMNRNVTQKLREGVRENYKANYSNAALILSGLLSAATDNAKELLMAEINATPQLFSMHLYLAVLGLDMEQIVELMTSDIAEDVVRLSDHNIFIKNRATGMAKIFTTLEGWYKGNDVKTNNLAVFKNIYHSSKEFSALAGLLGINQKRKANPWEIYDYLAKLENVFETTNELMLNSVSEQDYIEVKKGEVNEEWLNDITEKIALRNTLLRKDVNHIKSIVTEASDITVKYTDFNGQEAEKQVNIIKDGIDFRLYLNDENYKRVVKDYYNLIKHTFNVFDVMDNVPHFKGMVDSLVLTHDMLLNSSEKYNFVYGKVKDVFNMGNTLNSTWRRRYIDQYAVGKSASMFDMMVAEKWMKDKAGHINLNIQKLMELAGVDEYNVYINDRIKDQAIADVDDATVRQIKAKDGSNPIITLDSTYNIAMFKKVMEDLILPIIQKKLDTEFLDSLKLESVITPFGLNGSAIVSMHSLQELNTHTSLEQFEKLLNSFDSLDSEDELKGLIKNNVGAELKIRDLFFLYNLIVHQEKYGNKKLTPILINYMKEKNSLGYEYMKYYAEVDKGSIDLYEDLKIKYGEKWKEQLENNIFFHISNSRGMASITRNGEVNTVSITNPHITMMSNVDYTKKLNQKYTDINELARLIREKGWAVTLEC